MSILMFTQAMVQYGTHLNIYDEISTYYVDEIGLRYENVFFMKEK